MVVGVIVVYVVIIVFYLLGRGVYDSWVIGIKSDVDSAGFVVGIKYFFLVFIVVF